MCGICFICSPSAKSQTPALFVEDPVLGLDHNRTSDTGLCRNKQTLSASADVDATIGVDATISTDIPAVGLENDTNLPCECDSEYSDSDDMSRKQGRADEDLLLNTLLCDPLLHHRGPDVSRNCVIPLADNLDGCMQGCVLHLRGQLTPQPMSDPKGNAFLWNGEIFDGIQVEEHENDTQVLFGHLVNCLSEDDLLKTMQKVHGPWAFIFWQAETRKLWFGRDMYGRRSLLWHLPLSANDRLVLTSVALGEMAYTEIPSIGIFCLDFSQTPPSSTDAFQCPVMTLFSWKNCRWPGTFIPITETDEKNVLAYLYPNLPTCISVQIDRRNILDTWIPDINSQLPTVDTSSDNAINIRNCASLDDMLTNILNARSDLDALADNLIRVLQLSVDKRVKNLPRDSRSSQCQTTSEHKNIGSACGSSKLSAEFEGEVQHLHFHESESPVSQANVAILFSGGLDSTVLAALADRCVPEGEAIDLLNVAFEQPVTTNVSQKKTKTKQKKQTDYRKTDNSQQSSTDLSAVVTAGLDKTNLHISNSSDNHWEHNDECDPSESHLPNDDIAVKGCSSVDLSETKDKSSEALLRKNNTGCSTVHLSVNNRDKSSKLYLQKDNITLNGCSVENLSLYNEGKSSERLLPTDNIVPSKGSAADLSACTDLPSSVLHSVVSEQAHSDDKSNTPECCNSSSPPENSIKNNAGIAIDKDRFNVPDRQTGLLALSELNPKRVWNFVEINISQEELQDLRRSHIRKLIYPLQTVLDDSIGCAVWFAARGSGVVHHQQKFVSKARVILCGMAADEQFAGYSRHRVTFQTKGWEGLLKEVQEEMWRISARNLGRDDRIITDHGKECRFPFLDEKFTEFVSALPLFQRADLHLPRGVGDKLLLRLCAVKLGLMKTASQPKRAIQFGSRIAKLDKRKEKGSDVCDRLA